MSTGGPIKAERFHAQGEEGEEMEQKWGGIRERATGEIATSAISQTRWRNLRLLQSTTERVSSP